MVVKFPACVIHFVEFTDVYLFIRFLAIHPLIIVDIHPQYVGKESTHPPDTLRAIPSRVLNHLAKLTLRNPSLRSEGVDKVYPHHANALRKAGLTTPDFPTMGDLRKMQDEKTENENEKEPDVNKKGKQKRLFLRCLLTVFLNLYPHGHQQTKKDF